MDKRIIIASLINLANEFDAMDLCSDADAITRVAQSISQDYEKDIKSDDMMLLADKYEEELKFLDAEAELKKIVEELSAQGAEIKPSDFDAYTTILGEQYVSDIIDEFKFSSELEDNGAIVV